MHNLRPPTAATAPPERKREEGSLDPTPIDHQRPHTPPHCRQALSHLHEGEPPSPPHSDHNLTSLEVSLTSDQCTIWVRPCRFLFFTSTIITLALHGGPVTPPFRSLMQSCGDRSASRRFTCTNLLLFLVLDDAVGSARGFVYVKH
jgi:hypothetical protein